MCSFESSPCPPVLQAHVQVLYRSCTDPCLFFPLPETPVRAATCLTRLEDSVVKPRHSGGCEVGIVTSRAVPFVSSVAKRLSVVQWDDIRPTSITESSFTHVSFIVGKVLQDPSAPDRRNSQRVREPSDPYLTYCLPRRAATCPSPQSPPACIPKLSKRRIGAGNTGANARWLSRSEHKSLFISPSSSLM